MSDTTLVRNAQDAISIPDFAWAFFLSAAVQCGWEPLGTGAPEEETAVTSTYKARHGEWDGDYFDDEGQIMVRSDVDECRAALMRALKDKSLRQEPGNLIPRFQTRVADQQVELVINSTRQREMMRGLISFMSRGAFAIYCGEFTGAQTSFHPAGYIIRHTVDLIAAA